MNANDLLLIKNTIVDIPDYPSPGIIFKDLTPVLNSREIYSKTVKIMADEIAEKFPGVTHIVSPESRGYWFGCAIAALGGYGFVPLRKPGKLPRECVTVDYVLEYGTETLCTHCDSLKKGDKAVVVDDVLATGGTLAAAGELIEKLGAKLLGYSVLLELSFLKGREKLSDNLISLIVE